MCVMMTKEQLKQFDEYMAKQANQKGKVVYRQEWGDRVHVELNDSGYRALHQFHKAKKAA